jgi:hypothetical protein
VLDRRILDRQKLEYPGDDAPRRALGIRRRRVTLLKDNLNNFPRVKQMQNRISIGALVVHQQSSPTTKINLEGYNHRRDSAFARTKASIAART